ncbi:MAG: hypothetical protein DMG69_10855 [Acidobacteria bacterium]|nr:MAG: hypothetical protein DMG69_10855 [Acidobacteriota bacterium]
MFPTLQFGKRLNTLDSRMSRSRDEDQRQDITESALQPTPVTAIAIDTVRVTGRLAKPVLSSVARSTQ